MKYIDAERLKAKLDEHYGKYKSKYMETRDPYTQGLMDALDLAEQVIVSLQQEPSEVDVEEEITDTSRACCNCAYGLTRYPNCLCWQHKDCNTDDPYKIPQEDWIETAQECKSFELVQLKTKKSATHE